MTPVMPLFEGRLFVSLAITVSVARRQRLRGDHGGADLPYGQGGFLGLPDMVTATRWASRPRPDLPRLPVETR